LIHNSFLSAHFPLAYDQQAKVAQRAFRSSINGLLLA
jgi:hypothetical protein